MAKKPVAKKELNAEVLAYISALSVALKLNKEAMVVWQSGTMAVDAGIATIHTPCTFTIPNKAVRAADLYKALKDCDKQFTIAEVGNDLVISWGRRRASLKTVDRISVYVRDIDTHAGFNDAPPELTEILRDTLKDLGAAGGNEAYADFLQFYGNKGYWTNGTSMAQLQLPCQMPSIMLRLRDLKQILSGDTRDHISSVWWSGLATVTLYFASGVAIQMPQIDQGVVKYPTQVKLESFFVNELNDATYELTTEHFDAIEYVGGFAERVIYIEPTHIGTHEDPNEGTAHLTEGLPVSIRVSTDVAKLGAFNKATHLVKRSTQASKIGFFTIRPSIVFCFARFTVNGD